MEIQTSGGEILGILKKIKDADLTLITANAAWGCRGALAKSGIVQPHCQERLETKINQDIIEGRT